MSTNPLDDYTSNLLDGALRFGAYPSPILLSALLTTGYTLFIDLTTEEHDANIVRENGWVWPYYVEKANVVVVRYPIPDRTPGTVDATRVIVKRIVDALDKGVKVYIHCRGGHGRSACVAACVLVEKGYKHKEALLTVRQAHAKRSNMLPKWRKIGAPQTASQKSFVNAWQPSHTPNNDVHYV